MKAFRGLLTLCCVEEADLASGLAQLESELTDTGLDGPEAGERTSLICSPSAEAESSLWNAFAQCWCAAGSWRKRMVILAWCRFWPDCGPLSLIVMKGERYTWVLRQWEAGRSGFKVWIPGVSLGPSDATISNLAKLQMRTTISLSTNNKQLRWCRCVASCLNWAKYHPSYIFLLNSTKHKRVVAVFV